MDERALFGELCEKSLANQYEKEIAKENAKCSDSHYKKMSGILGYNVKRHCLHISKRLIAAILAAAILLLVGSNRYFHKFSNFLYTHMIFISVHKCDSIYFI